MKKGWSIIQKLTIIDTNKKLNTRHIISRAMSIRHKRAKKRWEKMLRGIKIKLNKRNIENFAIVQSIWSKFQHRDSNVLFAFHRYILHTYKQIDVESAIFPRKKYVY